MATTPRAAFVIKGGGYLYRKSSAIRNKGRTAEVHVHAGFTWAQMRILRQWRNVHRMPIGYRAKVLTLWDAMLGLGLCTPETAAIAVGRMPTNPRARAVLQTVLNRQEQDCAEYHI